MFTRSIECPACGATNAGDATYCKACGATLRQGQVKHPAQRSRKIPKFGKKEKYHSTRFYWGPTVFVLVAIAGMICFSLFMNYVVMKKTARPTPIVEVKSNDPVIEKNVMIVASKFICSCGTCGQKPLETCTCNTAKDERQFIRTNLVAGKTPDQVIAAVNITYGWMKPEFVGQLDTLNTMKPRAGSGVDLSQPPKTR